MPITTNILVQPADATSSTSGFNPQAGTPANFRDNNDAGAFSDIKANMSNAAATASHAVNRLDFANAYLTTPLATRTTRKIKVRASLVAVMHSSAPAGSSCKAGLRYSLNGGSSFITIVELNNTTPNSTLTSSGQTIYEVAAGINVNQDVSQIMIEAYCDVASGAGGGTANASFANVQADWGIVEDYEDAVNMILVRPNSTVFTTFTTHSTPGFTNFNASNSSDGVEATRCTQGNSTNYGLGFVGAFVESVLTAQFPHAILGGGVVHAQIVWLWEADITLTGSPEVTCNGECYCEWQENSAVPSSHNTSAKAYINRNGAGSASRTLTKFTRDITSAFRQTEEVLAKMHTYNIYNPTGAPTPSNHTLTAYTHEFYLEIRVPIGGGGAGSMGGWENV